MAAPRCLTNATTTMTFDDIDMHLYGMTVLSVRNPVPPPVESFVQIHGRDGAIDYTKSLSVRTITVDGEIVADSHSELLTYIDNINTLIRLRENGKPFKLIFNDQTDRYWSVRLQSSDMVYKGLKSRGRTMSYSLQFVCVKPYAESIVIYNYYSRLTIFKPIAIYNLGTLKSPIQMSVTNTFDVNAIESATAYDADDRNAFAAGTNATLTIVETPVLYGAYSAEVAQVAAGAFYAAIDMTAAMVAGQDYIIGIYVRAYDGIMNITPSLIMTGDTTIVGTTYQVAATSGDWILIKFPISGLLTATATTFSLSLATATDDTTTKYHISGSTCYKTGKRHDGSYNNVPYPYTVGITTVVNPKLTFFSGINIFPYKNGDALTNWTNSGMISLTKDPLGDDNVICAQAATTAGYAWSELVYVNSDSKYHISLKRYVEYYTSGSTVPIQIYQFDEMFNLIVANTFSFTMAQNSSYADTEMTITIQPGVHCIRLYIRNTDAVYKMYIKDIMIAPEITTGEAIPDYVEPLKTVQNYIGSIAQLDTLSIDNENGYVRYEDFSAGTIINAMSGFSGGLVQARPGYNFMHLQDARRAETLVSGTPEEESVGNLAVTWSYRARYL